MLRNEPILFDAVDRDAYVERPEVQGPLLDAVNSSRGVLLIGPSGSGRTTTLNWLAREVTGRPVARVDAALADSATVLVEAIRASLIEALEPRPDALRLTESLTLGEGTTEAVRLQGLVRQFGRVARCVVLIDNLTHAVTIKTVFGGLRELLWESKHTFVCTCRPEDTASFLTPPADSFFRKRVVLPPLTESELTELLRRSQLPLDHARKRIAGVPHQPRAVISSLDAPSNTAELLATEPEGVDSTAARVWREVVLLGRPVTANDAELQARAGLSPPTLRRQLRELAGAGLLERFSERSGQPGRPLTVYTPARGWQ